jgi:putative ABC transport system permease protein
MDGHAKPVDSSDEASDNGIVDEAVDAEAANNAADKTIEDERSEPTSNVKDRSDASSSLSTDNGVRLVQASDESSQGDAAKPKTENGIQKPDQYRLLSIPEREVTSILVRNGNVMFAPAMQNAINEGIQAQAAAPIGEINKLMDLIVGPLMTALLAITLITCVVAAVGILVSIYNSMNDRRRDIAVMRALGARRTTVTAIIICESFLVALIGAVTGWILAHAAIWLYSGRIEEQTGVQVGFFTTSNYELIVLPLVLCLALIAALLPAFSAYRTDVGSNLSA